MNYLWYRCCHWLCVRLYYERVALPPPDRRLERAPTLYVGLHRNGAVDGFVYHQFAPRGIFLISTQLLRSGFARLFFSGIAVARKQDEEDAGRNDAALRQCVRLLADGGELLVFPEGTSSLGPRHLPFKSGAASLAVAALSQGVPLRIVPLGIHYERAWAFRSKIEVVAGDPFLTDFASDLSDLGRLREMKRRISCALEAVGTNFPSSEVQEIAQSLAYVATLGTTHRYFVALKAFESGVPEQLVTRWRELESKLASRRVLTHQGVPLFPVGPWLAYAALLLALGPLVVTGALVNLPPLLAAWLAGRKLADDRNVVALWRILIGVPLFGVWSVGVGLALGLGMGWLWMLGYALVTVAALKALYRTKKLGVAVWNGLAHRDLAGNAREFHQAVLQTLQLP